MLKRQSKYRWYDTREFNVFHLTDDGLKFGLSKPYDDYGGKHFLLIDEEYGFCNKVYLQGNVGVEDQPLFQDKVVFSARPSLANNDTSMLSLGERRTYGGVVIESQSLVELPVYGVPPDCASELVPGAYCFRSDGRYNLGYVRTGPNHSWRKHQLCILEPGDFMFYVNHLMQVSLLLMHKTRLVLRKPNKLQMIRLREYQERNIL